MRVHSSFLWCEALVWCDVDDVHYVWTEQTWSQIQQKLKSDHYSEVVTMLWFHSQFHRLSLFVLLIVSIIIFPAVIVIIVEFAVFAAPTVILLQIICARRAGECLRWFTLIFNVYVYCQCLMLTVCTKGLRVTQFQFSVCMCCTCGRIDNKADLTWLDLIIWELSNDLVLNYFAGRKNSQHQKK